MKQIIILLLFIPQLGCYSKAPEKTELAGKPLPVFTLQLSDSTHYMQTSVTQNNKPVALFYFGPHCPYSQEQAKEITEDIERLKNIQFYFVTGAPLVNMREFIKKHHLDQYSNIIIGRDTSYAVLDYYEIRGVPYTALYTKDKKFHQSFYGKINSSEILGGTQE